MRTRLVPRVLIAVLAALLVAVYACGTSSSPDPVHLIPLSDANSPAPVDPQYCNKYCQAEASSGTLTGTFQECAEQCCTMVPAGCAGIVDSGTGPSEDTGTVIYLGDSGHPNMPDASTDACAKPCGSTCCGDGEGCAAGACVATCTTSADCPSTSCCAPSTNGSGDPIGPYVCKPNDGENYDCCNLTDCNDGFCCVVDVQGNQFCAASCTGSTGCGSAQCLSSYDISSLHTSCALEGVTAACGP